MTPECRRCHYALEDFINNDVFACLDSGPELSSRRCFTFDREGYNYEQDFFSIIKPEFATTLDLTIAGDGGEGEDGKGAGAYNYGGN